MKNVNNLIAQATPLVQNVIVKYNSDYPYNVTFNRLESLIEGFRLSLDNSEQIPYENLLDKLGISIHALRYILSLSLDDRIEQVIYYNGVIERATKKEF